MSKWVTAFAQSQCGCKIFAMNVGGRTFRAKILCPIEGNKVRLKFGSVYGNRIDVKRVSVTVNGQTKIVTLGGKESFTVKHNEYFLSDEVAIDVNGKDTIDVRCYFADNVTVMTGCKVYAEYSKVGDYTVGEFTKSEDNVWVKENRPIDIGIPMPLVFGIDVFTEDDNAYAIAVFGASNEYLGRWVNPFTEKVYNSLKNVSVINMSISGGRLLKGTGNKLAMGNLFGDSALKRAKRDIFEQSGVKYLMTEIGGNDLFQPGTFATYPWEQVPSAKKLQNGFITLNNMAKQNNITHIMMTLTPGKGSNKATKYKSDVRREVNEWIRTSGEFDKVFDFAKYIVSPEDPDIMNPPFDSGDHVHFNEKGGLHIAESIDIKEFFE